MLSIPQKTLINLKLFFNNYQLLFSMFSVYLILLNQLKKFIYHYFNLNQEDLGQYF